LRAVSAFILDASVASGDSATRLDGAREGPRARTTCSGLAPRRACSLAVTCSGKGNTSRKASTPLCRSGKVPCTLFPTLPGSPRARAHQAMKCLRSSKTPHGSTAFTRRGFRPRERPYQAMKCSRSSRTPKEHVVARGRRFCGREAHGILPIGLEKFGIFAKVC
jgi:hypothetical protein